MSDDISELSAKREKLINTQRSLHNRLEQLSRRIAESVPIFEGVHDQVS